jgi:predicted NAD/FAD-binding protein
MPHTKKAWASWNYMRGHKLEAPSGVCITYWMNNLQPLPTSKDIFVTLNPEIPPKTSHIYGEYSYKHPIFSPQTDSAQSLSISLQGSHRTWYCGSYLGHGFHEDGIQSGLWVAGQLGSPPPWRDHVGYNRLPSSYD